MSQNMSRDSTSESAPLSPKIRSAHPFRFFVCGFPSSATEQDLLQLFGAYHPILDVKIIREVDGSSKGYGFITTLTKEDTNSFLNSPSKFEFKGRALSTGPAYRSFDNGPLEYLVATPHGVFPSQSIATKHKFMASTGLSLEAAPLLGALFRPASDGPPSSTTTTANKSPNTASQTEFPSISVTSPSSLPSNTVTQSAAKQGYSRSTNDQRAPVTAVTQTAAVPLMSCVPMPCNSSLPNMNHYFHHIVPQHAPPAPVYAYSFFATPNGNIPALVAAYPPHTIVSPVGHVQFAFPPPNIGHVDEHSDMSGCSQMRDHRDGDVYSNNSATAVTSFDSGIGDVSNSRCNSRRSHQNGYNMNHYQQEERGKQPLTYSQAVRKRNCESHEDDRNGKPRERKNTGSSGGNRKDNGGRIFPPVHLEIRRRGEDGNFMEPFGEQKSDKTSKGIGYKKDGKDVSSASSTSSVSNRISRLDLKDKKINLDKNMNVM